MQKTPHPHQLEIMAEHLADGAAGPEENPVEIPQDHVPMEDIKSPSDGLGDGETGVDDAVEQSHLRQRPAPEVPEAVEKYPHGQELDAGDDGETEGHQDEGGSVLHLRVYGHPDQLEVDADIVHGINLPG